MDNINIVKNKLAKIAENINGGIFFSYIITCIFFSLPSIVSKFNPICSSLLIILIIVFIIYGMVVFIIKKNNIIHKHIINSYTSFILTFSNILNCFIFDKYISKIGVNLFIFLFIVLCLVIVIALFTTKRLICRGIIKL